MARTERNIDMSKYIQFLDYLVIFRNILLWTERLVVY